MFQLTLPQPLLARAALIESSATSHYSLMNHVRVIFFFLRQHQLLELLVALLSFITNKLCMIDSLLEEMRVFKCSDVFLNIWLL